MFPVIRNAPGGKGGRCVWLTTYHHYSADVMKTGSLNSPGPLGAYMACWGRLNLYILYYILDYIQHNGDVSLENYEKIVLGSCR